MCCRHTPALALIAEVSLAVFLAMSLMSMELSSLASLAGPLFFVLPVQVALAIAFALFVAFPALGRNYDAAVICAGLMGFGLGATPTAMAKMTAVTQRHGASHVAFLVVPLVGAFFLDLLNTDEHEYPAREPQQRSRTCGSAICTSFRLFGGCRGGSRARLVVGRVRETAVADRDLVRAADHAMGRTVRSA